MMMPVGLGFLLAELWLYKQIADRAGKEDSANVECGMRNPEWCCMRNKLTDPSLYLVVITHADRTS